MKKTYRLYGLVPYNISPIQQAIQFGHAAVEYAHYNHLDIRYKKWFENDKTFIILNGGTTNSNLDRLGSLNQNLIEARKLFNNISEFYEPDLGDQLTAFVFLVEDLVFDKETYHDEFYQMCFDKELNPMQYGFPSYEYFLLCKQQRDFLNRFRLA